MRETERLVGLTEVVAVMTMVTNEILRDPHPEALPSHFGVASQ